MTDNIQNGEGVPFMPVAKLTDDMLIETGSEVITWGELSRRHSLAREPATADVDAAIAIVRQHAARIGAPSITVVAAPSSEPAIAEGERAIDVAAEMLRFEAAYPYTDRTKHRNGEVVAGRVRYAEPEVDKMFSAWLRALAQSSTPPASKGVAE